MSDELKIVLEDVKEKFDPVIEAFNDLGQRWLKAGPWMPLLDSDF